MKSRWTLFTFLFATSVFFLLSVTRHWTFASGSRDLGLFYQTHWLIVHGLPAENTVMGLHALTDHMALLDYVIAQFLRFYDGPETLLFVQAVAVASAVFPLANLGCRFLGGEGPGLVLAWAWLLSPDVHSGLMFDYNPTMLGAPGLVWTAWALLCGSPAAALLATLVTCLARENLCLYAAVLAIILGFRGVSWRRSLGAATLALAVFAVDMSVLFRAPFDPGVEGTLIGVSRNWARHQGRELERP